VRLGDGVGAVDSPGFIGLPTPQGHAKIALQRMRVCCCVGWEKKNWIFQIFSPFETQLDAIFL